MRTKEESGGKVLFFTVAIFFVIALSAIALERFLEMDYFRIALVAV